MNEEWLNTSDISDTRLAEKRHQMTLEGLADIAAGNIVDHQVIEEWLASLSDGEEEPNL